MDRALPLCEKYRLQVLVDLHSGQVEEVRRASDLSFDPGYISLPEPVEAQDSQPGPSNGRWDHVELDFEGPADLLSQLRSGKVSGKRYSPFASAYTRHRMRKDLQK